MEILISIIIPTYNYGAYIRRSVTSVISQLTENIELIVVDDGSTDNTAEVIADLQSSYPMKIMALSKPNGGAASARNVGIVASKGRFLLFLDADDELAPNALKHYVRHIHEHPDSTLVLAGHCAIFPNGKLKKILPGHLPETAEARVKAYLLRRSVSVVAGASMFHREIFEKAMFTESLGNHEDVKVFATSLAFCKLSILNEIVVLIHKHSDSLRHNINYSMASRDILPAVVFESLPASMQYLKIPYQALIDLSLCRHYYFAKKYADSWSSYKNAVGKNALLFFKFSYTRKALKAWFKK